MELDLYSITLSYTTDQPSQITALRARAESLQVAIEPLESERKGFLETGKLQLSGRHGDVAALLKEMGVLLSRPPRVVYEADDNATESIESDNVATDSRNGDDIELISWLLNFSNKSRS